jgi:hypothetical protein
MKTLISSGLVSGALAVSLLSPLPAHAGNTPPLAPGKPAGVHQAELGADMVLWTVVGAAVIVAIVLAANSGGATATSNTISAAP